MARSSLLRGTEYTQEEMEQDAVTRWNFGEVATLRVDWPAGLASGDHTIEQATQMRISYLPAPLRGRDVKTLAAA